MPQWAAPLRARNSTDVAPRNTAGWRSLSQPDPSLLPRASSLSIASAGAFECARAPRGHGFVRSRGVRRRRFQSSRGRGRVGNDTMFCKTGNRVPRFAQARSLDSTKLAPPPPSLAKRKQDQERNAKANRARERSEEY